MAKDKTAVIKKLIDATVSIDGKVLESLTKIEISPIMNSKGYAISLRFALTNSYSPPLLSAGSLSRLSFKHNSLEKEFVFSIEYLDIGIESNPLLTEITVFLRATQVKQQSSLVTMPQKQLVIV